MAEQDEAGGRQDGRVERTRHDRRTSASEHPDRRARVVRPPRGEEARRSCATRATRRSTRSSSGRARTSRTPTTSRCPRSRSTSRRRSTRSALVENLRAESEGRRPSRSSASSAPYTDLTFEEQVDFYRHDGNWSNRMILGDSLLVMTSLAEKEGLKGQVQMIYIDPPYGIKFGSQLAGLTRKRDVKDGKDADLTRQPEQIKAFRDTWELGIHSYLAYLRDRLAVARELLTESGSVFVQIGDENVHLVRALLDEVFGGENFVSPDHVHARRAGASGATCLPESIDYVLWYARRPSSASSTGSSIAARRRRRQARRCTLHRAADGTRRRDDAARDDVELRISADGVRAHSDMATRPRPDKRPGNCSESSSTAGRSAQATGSWKTNARRAWSGSALARSARWPSAALSATSGISMTFPCVRIDQRLDRHGDGGFTDDKIYVVQTNTKVVERCLLMTTDPGDLVLDPTCGSGTTAYVAEQWGRRWITIDTSRVALALARSRLMAAKYPYYLLADSEAGIRKEAELTGQAPPADRRRPTGDIRHGFVYERVPHVTLKSIAQNPDIREGMSREEIDAAIARHAETEMLFDRPYEDTQDRPRVRPVHRREPVAAPGPGRRPRGRRRPTETDSVGRRRALRHEHPRQPAPGRRPEHQARRAARVRPPRPVSRASTSRAIGEYVEDGAAKTVAIAIGPEFGTVGPELVREAAKEAVKVADLLVVCGFAFDPLAGEEASARSAG